MNRREFKVLVVEDDPAMLRFIRRTLEINEMEVAAATDGLAALKTFRVVRPDLVVLDITIPEMDGLEVCQRLKSAHQVPILIVTAKGTDEDLVRGFELGADDYLAKPFAGKVLVARVKGLLRRARAPSSAPGDRIECGELVIDFASRHVYRRGQHIHLTFIEFKLLALLVGSVGKVLTSEQIISEIWGAYGEGDAQMLRTHVGRLRKKIEPDHTRPSLILTERGVGYWMSCPPPHDFQRK